MTPTSTSASAEPKGVAAQRTGGGLERSAAAMNGRLQTPKATPQGFWHPNGPAGRFLYDCFFALGSILMGMLFPLRVTGGNVVPRTGPFLLIANHQSYLDPPMLGQTCYRRRLHYLAMSGLFTLAPFRWLISSLGAIPIERTGNAGPGLKASLKCLSEGHGLVIFPEGGRTVNGSIQPFKRGAMLLIRKTNAPVVVAGIAGAYDAWPWFKNIFRFRPIWIHYTTWRWPEGAREEQAFDDLYRTVQSAVARAERGWRRIGGREIETRRYKPEDWPE
jgi:1-acyl-sn-glycerol-3-phosphate acyltransferase